MALPIPEGKQIVVERNLRPSGFCMPSMEMATDHYSVGYVITGDRKVIMPSESLIYHSGDVTLGMPYMYHRTVSNSDIPYDSYIIKFTPEFIKPFINQVEKKIFDELCGQRVFNFSDEFQIKIERIFFDMLEEYNKNSRYTEFVLQGMLYRLLITIWENKINNNVMINKSPLSKSIVDILYYIENNYYKKITLEKIAQMAHFSNSYFSRMFKLQMGISFTEYLNNVRVTQAKKMLIQTNKSIMEIAVDVGYCHGDYLSIQFKNKTGMTPSQFRNSLKK